MATYKDLWFKLKTKVSDSTLDMMNDMETELSSNTFVSTTEDNSIEDANYTGMNIEEEV